MWSLAPFHIQLVETYASGLGIPAPLLLLWLPEWKTATAGPRPGTSKGDGTSRRGKRLLAPEGSPEKNPQTKESSC